MSSRVFRAPGGYDLVGLVRREVLSAAERAAGRDRYEEPDYRAANEVLLAGDAGYPDTPTLLDVDDESLVLLRFSDHRPTDPAERIATGRVTDLVRVAGAAGGVASTGRAAPAGSCWPRKDRGTLGRSCARRR